MSVNILGPIHYCPHCRGAITERLIGDRPRAHCPACGVTFYADPKLAVAVLVESNGQVLLQRRTIDPGLGCWTFPSGYVERGERVEDAAVREVLEETGLRVRLTRLQGLYSQAGRPVVLAVYVAEPIGGTLAAGDETDAVALFSPDALPPLAFDHDEDIIATWRGGDIAPVHSPEIVSGDSEY